MSMEYFGKYPGVIDSYDQDARRCRVSIPGITDGGDLLPLAEMLYALGDQSEDTEVKINGGERVWIEFEAGDSRYPIIVGFRTKNAGNGDGNSWRRWHQTNIHLDAEEIMRVSCKTLIVEAAESAQVTTKQATIQTQTFAVNASESASITSPIIGLNGQLSIAGLDGESTTATINAQINLQGGIQATDDIVAGDISLKEHKTSGVDTGTGTSGPPVP